MSDRSLIWGLIGFSFILRTILASALPLTPDEAYYWVWSQHLQAGYIDHPPMVALWIRAGTWLWGQNPFSVRFIGLAASLIASVALSATGRVWWPKAERVGERAACLLNVTLLFGVGMANTTPDTPLLFFITLTIWALSYALSATHKTAHLLWWSLTGLCLGLAAVSKYTALFLAIGIAGYVLLGRGQRWRSLGPWCAGALTSIMILPVLWWNVTHHWASFAKQGGRAGVWHPARAAQFLSELLAGQIGLMTPVVFLGVLMGGWHLARKKDAPVLLWCLIPGCMVFVIHACGDRVQANWPSVLYPVCMLIAASGARRYWRPAVWSGALLCGFVGVQALWQPLPLPAHWNPIIRQTAGWEIFVQNLTHEAEQRGAQAIVTDDYALASIIAFYSPHHKPLIMGQDARWAYLEGIHPIEVPKALMVRDGRYVFAGEGVLVRTTPQGRAVRGYHVQLRSHVSGRSLP